MANSRRLCRIMQRLSLEARQSHARHGMVPPADGQYSELRTTPQLFLSAQISGPTPTIQDAKPRRLLGKVRVLDHTLANAIGRKGQRWEFRSIQWPHLARVQLPSAGQAVSNVLSPRRPSNRTVRIATAVAGATPHVSIRKAALDALYTARDKMFFEDAAAAAASIIEAAELEDAALEAFNDIVYGSSNVLQAVTSALSSKIRANPSDTVSQLVVSLLLDHGSSHSKWYALHILGCSYAPETKERMQRFSLSSDPDLRNQAQEYLDEYDRWSGGPWWRPYSNSIEDLDEYDREDRTVLRSPGHRSAMQLTASIKRAASRHHDARRGASPLGHVAPAQVRRTPADARVAYVRQVGHRILAVRGDSSDPVPFAFLELAALATARQPVEDADLTLPLAAPHPGTDPTQPSSSPVWARVWHLLRPAARRSASP